MTCPFGAPEEDTWGSLHADAAAPLRAMGSDVLQGLYTAGGGGVPPPLPMFEAGSQNFCFGAERVKNVCRLKMFVPPSAGTIGEPWEEGGSQPTPPPPLQTPPSPPSHTSLAMGLAARKGALAEGMP